MVQAAILAGGKSSRMGTDKGSLIVAGETLLARTVRLATIATGTSPLVIGRAFDANIPALFLPDETPDIGPLGGLATALQAAPDTAILAISCDLPALTEQVLRWLLAQERGIYGVAARNGEQIEPLFAVYTPAVLAPLEAQLLSGKRSLHGVIARCGEQFTLAEAPPEVAAALLNVNTAAEWKVFQNRAAQSNEPS